MTNPSRPARPLLIVFLLLAAALFLPAMALADTSQREAELEERVAELERLVHRLLAEREEDQRETAGMRERVESVDERVAAVEDKPPGQTKVTRSDETRFTYGGYIKTDILMTRFSDGSLPARNVGRDFYVPATVPVGGESSGTDFDAHVKESRFWFRTDTTLDNGEDISGYLEFDFTSGAPGGDERLTNAYSPGIRHAWLSYRNWLVGQTWSNFFIVGALAENLDFVGPAEGTVFVRQPMIRYDNGPWQFSVENPETTVTPFGGGARIVTDTGWAPDVTARYNLSGDWGSFSVAALARQMAVRTNGSRETETGFGISAGGTLSVGERNDIRYMATYGSGIGRYLGLNTTNDAVLTEDGSLEAIDAYGGFVSYRHFWTPNWRSNFTLSGQWIDNDISLTGTGATKESVSGHVNLIHQVNSALSFGVEYIYARRKIESGESGDMNRLQFSGMYHF